VNAWLILVPLVAILAIVAIGDVIAFNRANRRRDRTDAERDRGDGPHRGPGGMWRL
jgi:hypothetical protein